MADLVDIAILDDDLDFRNYLEDLLRDEGDYQVRAFASAEELFNASEQQAPEIVLLDMKMGADDGLHVAESLLGRWPGICPPTPTCCRSRWRATARSACH